MAKWQKYQRTRAYLEREIAGLSHALLPQITNFHTTSMTSQSGDMFLSHQFAWTSDTVDGTAALTNMRVRESVQWPQWPAPAIQLMGAHTAEYQRPGNHNGLGNNPATTGAGTDNHSLLGPFNQDALNYQGAQPISITMTQVYEFTRDNGATWNPIPNSGYTITRTITARQGGGAILAITKSHVNNHQDTFTVTKEFPPPPPKK